MSAVYSAIAAVMAHMAKEGISKDRRNDQQGYRFRGIDDVYNALSSVLAANKLMMLPYVQDMQREERQTQRGGVLNYTILTVDFNIVSAEDGSNHTIRTIGEAMDSADKSSNKAMSAALKYAAMQVFMIPTEGDNDADSTTHEMVSTGPAKRTKLDGIHTSKTALKGAVHAIRQKVSKAKTDAEITAIMREGAETVRQAERDWPELIEGDPNIEEDDGLRGFVTRRREEFANPSETSATCDALISAMEQMDSRQQLAAWYEMNQTFIDELEDADRREFDRHYEILESGLMQVALMGAG